MENFSPLDINFNEGYVINVDKPLGWTSTDVVRKIKFLLRKLGYKRIKVGHAGTLDPLATGVLLICIGKATKKVDSLQAEKKEYVTEIKLGATTPSFDLEHEIDRIFPSDHITGVMVTEVLKDMCGEQLQLPPVYSAKRIEGQRAYEYAREGDEVVMRKALVNIFSMELLDFNFPVVKVRITCSKGTYIRAIARDLGEKLDSGAHLISLRRTKSGDFSVEESFDMDEIINSLNVLKQN